MWLPSLAPLTLHLLQGRLLPNTSQLSCEDRAPVHVSQVRKLRAREPESLAEGRMAA